MGQCHLPAGGGQAVGQVTPQVLPHVNLHHFLPSLPTSNPCIAQPNSDRPALSSSLPHHRQETGLQRATRLPGLRYDHPGGGHLVERIQVEFKICFIGILKLLFIRSPSGNSSKFTLKFNTFLFLNYSIVISTILSIFFHRLCQQTCLAPYFIVRGEGPIKVDGTRLFRRVGVG